MPIPGEDVGTSCFKSHWRSLADLASHRNTLRTGPMSIVGHFRPSQSALAAGRLRLHTKSGLKAGLATSGMCATCYNSCVGISFDAGELRALLPEPSCRDVVLGLRGRAARPGPEEVAAAEIGDLGGGGQIHDGFRSLLGRDREHLRSPQGERQKSAGFPAEVAGDEARMQAVDGDTLADPPAG